MYFDNSCQWRKNVDFLDSKGCSWLCRRCLATHIRPMSQSTTPLSDVPYANNAQGRTPETTTIGKSEIIKELLLYSTTDATNAHSRLLKYRQQLYSHSICLNEHTEEVAIILFRVGTVILDAVVPALATSV